MAARDLTKKFTFSVRTRTLFWRRADEKGETPAPPRRVTLGQLPYLPHTAATLGGLSRLDRACLAFCRFVVARRVVACVMIAGLYSLLAGAGVALGCLDLSPNYQYEWVIDAKRSTRNHDMRRAAVAAVDALSSQDTVEPRTDEHLPTWVEYAAAPHVFTAPNLQKICQVEARFYGEPSYQRVCVMDEGACAAPAASALTAFYGTDHLQNLARGNASCHLGGAATTLGAAALMLPCQLTFFYKLGLLIFTTIFCSLVFAFGFVMPLLAAAGPSGDWCGFSLPGQKRHHGGRVAAAPLEADAP